MVKGKPNKAHCVRFPGDWYHVFEIGTRSIGFSIKVQVKKGSSILEVVVGPENRTVVSGDNLLRVNIIGDFAGYKSVPSFEDFYLVTPRKGAVGGQPQDIGNEYSRWMLLERFRFTYNGLECDKIGVGYEAFQEQPDFCSSEFWSCLHNQLWNFIEEDKIRKSQSLQPMYTVEGRFERINQHPNAGPYSFSVGVTEILDTNLLVELNADDIQYVYQRSPGKIISIKVPTFEALQIGVANVTTRNTGKLEASYSLTLKCEGGINNLEEQFFIMKPDEVASRLFSLRTSTDEAVNYQCTAILKAADFNELDRTEVEFNTTATVLNNGTQVVPPKEPKKGGSSGFFEGVKAFLLMIWDGVINLFTGMLCSTTKCSSFFDFSCYFQHLCIGSMVMSLGLILALVAVPLWILHQRGFFDHLGDWWEDRFGLDPNGRAHAIARHRRGHHQQLLLRRHWEPPPRRHHKGGPSHPEHHHRVLHRHDEQLADVYRHSPELLGVHHRDGLKHRRGRAVAALNLDGLRQQAPSWPPLHKTTDDREPRGHKRQYSM